MNQADFFMLIKKIVSEYVNSHMDVTDGKCISPDDVYVVWSCKTLQNWKALVSTPLLDGMYYELTLNGDMSIWQQSELSVKFKTFHL